MAPRVFLVPIDMSKLEVQNLRLHVLSTAPSSPVTGQLYYDSDDNIAYFWNGSSWVSMQGGAGGIPGTIGDAKGDIITFSAADTPVRKAVGADGTFLVAASGQSDGLQWRTIADSDIPSTIFRDSEHTAASHQEIISTADLTDWPRSAALDLNGQKITTLGTPTADGDAATKAYVDAVSSGLNWKDSVRAATTGPITISTGLNNGDSIDGVTLVTGDRVLVKDQAAPAENGIYVVAASPGRSPDADTAADILSAAVWVEEGTANADTGWLMTTNAPITLGTTGLTWVQFNGLGQITAGTGLTKSGNTLNVGAGTGIVANADDVAVLRTDANGRVPLKFAANVGDGAATSYNIDHNLNSLDVLVQVFRVSDGAQVEVDVIHSTVNRVILNFASAPASNAYRVIVYG